MLPTSGKPAGIVLDVQVPLIWNPVMEVKTVGSVGIKPDQLPV
jgi:hypothetical protein